MVSRLKWMNCFAVVLLLAAVNFSSAYAGTFAVSSRSDMTEKMVRIRATQFLQRATFGPTQAEVDALTLEMIDKGVTQAASDWIDAQFAMQHTSHVATAKAMLTADGWEDDEVSVGITRYRYQAWWHNAITAPDQLKQRVAWALMQICVVGQTGSGFNSTSEDNLGQPRWLGLSNYYDMLLENSDDTYRDVLGDVTFSPIMGVYLSHLRNKKGDPANGVFPDENYAREIMQLFSIGLYELKQNGEYKKDAQGEDIPTYGNEEIKAFARLFTGLNYAGSTTVSNGSSNLHTPMIMHESGHDQDPKTLLQGVTLPATTDGVADINAGLDNLYAHPNVAPFISRLLIQRLVRSNPSKRYLGRVSAVFRDNGQGVRGDLKAVVKAILLDRECWNSIRITRVRSPLSIKVRGTGTERSRMMEPVVMYASFIRRFGNGVSVTHTDNDDNVTTPDSGGWYKLPGMGYNWSQQPYSSPSVFNFYSPNYQPAGPISSFTASKRIPNRTLYAPEFQLFDAVVANRMANRYRNDIRDAKSDVNTVNNAKAGKEEIDVLLDFSTEEALAGDAESLVEHLDLTLCAGTMTNAMRNALVAAINDEPNASNANRARGALLAVMMSPANVIAE
ncbi:DUF1800 domain-containing protein [Stieleria marina]|uniref:DUF1800 domain-containing protein n=1 Tax=Stieleria marina TaxID=1930275 RepID=A0A517NNV0_9BACT|nr:hypothetical protein K239x_07470 [Planctomycetes bacterium K23_9]